MKVILNRTFFKAIALIITSINFILSHDENRIIKFKELNLNEEETYIPVKSGHKFTIELEGNITTGYLWFLDKSEKLAESGLIKPTNLKENSNTVEYYQIGNNKINSQEIRKLGAGGIFHFSFLAGEKSGHEKLTFIYKRPWSEQEKIEKSINVKIVNLNSKNDL